MFRDTKFTLQGKGKTPMDEEQGRGCVCPTPRQRAVLQFGGRDGSFGGGEGQESEPEKLASDKQKRELLNPRSLLSCAPNWRSVTSTQGAAGSVDPMGCSWGGGGWGIGRQCLP